MKLVRSSISIVCGLPCVTVRSAPAIIVSGPAQRSLSLWPARSPSRLATLYIESSDSFVASAAVSIVTGCSEPVPGRELHPLKSSAFHGALLRQLTRHSVSNIARMTVAQRVVFAWLAVIVTLFAPLLATLAGGPLVRALFQCFAFVPAPTSWIVNGSEMWTGMRFEKGCYLSIFSLRGEMVLERCTM
jgi:hypothetical protein